MIELRVDPELGRSIYATERIHQGAEILVLPLATVAQADMYSIEASPGLHVDCSQSLAGALNHSCRANARVRHFRVIAWECIEPGDEITIDYRLTEGKLAAPFTCLCGHCDGRDMA